MKIPHLIAAELRRLVSTPLSAVALLALLAVPILYGGLYLWANQDPYSQLGRIPAAVVVEDEGAEIRGSERNLGDEIAQELLRSGTFDWTEGSADEVNAGLRSGRYDFAVVIPSGFSASIASINSTDPQQATIELQTNDANSYLGTTIGTEAVQRVETLIVRKVVDEVALALLDGLAEIRSKLSDAAGGASRLTEGLSSAASGGERLQSGAQELVNGIGELQAGAERLASGSRQVAGGVDQIDAVAREVGSVAAEAAALVPQARTDLAHNLTALGLTQAEVAQVLTLLNPVGERIEQLDDRAQATVARINELDAGADEVASGAQTLSDGLGSASSGASELLSGVGELRSGIGELQSGANELSTGLSDGVSQIPDDDTAVREAQSRMLSDPLRIDTSAIAPAQNYGAGLAPFFAALAAWIGIYALFLIVRPVSRRAISAMYKPIRISVAGWLTPALLGAVQMAGLFGVLALALDFRFAEPWATFGLLVLASASYTWIILALNVWLGAVGQFLGLVLMVLQLVTAGGTFPWQTLPTPLAALHGVLPMGHVVDALRQVMYGGDPARVRGDIAVLLAWALGAALIATAGTARMRLLTLRELQPSILQ
ncbi:YhgE/Pip domain-containing protein [Georgenia sp. 311]|uniref:YhgE/Pip domain-containing protein n=1 Tax=Georgenia sp. 311 TaxID=2585134 RepID=UPI0011129BB3|nr:YhgE/Pip domain-containing protein [Georgenia sp. 311]TNC20951.1 YhgE/Pip domain-containing protein [Georgenia sp. 311]